jgi:hypothetical protein
MRCEELRSYHLWEVSWWWCAGWRRVAVAAVLAMVVVLLFHRGSFILMMLLVLRIIARHLPTHGAAVAGFQISLLAGSGGGSRGHAR